MKKLGVGDTVKITEESLENGLSPFIHEERLVIKRCKSGIFSRYIVKWVVSGVEKYFYGDELVVINDFN